MRSVAYRLAAPLVVLICFLSMSWLYGWGNPVWYKDILRWYGVMPFRFPFVDISGSLAAWECTRQGVDVILSDPCDVLSRSYSYSPLWMAASSIPLGVSDTMTVGWCLDLLFIGSLALLPPPQCPIELVLVLAATLSTMVAFALERANPDILLFMLALAPGLLAECRVSLRMIGYCLALFAALLKYYPITVLIIVFRECPSRFVSATIAIVGSLAVFWAVYHTEIAEGLPMIPQGPYNTDLFAAKNLPFLLGAAAGSAAEPSSWAPLAERGYACAIYATLVGISITICRRLLRFNELRDALASLDSLERIFLVIGSAVIVGCFFAGQSVGYRGVYFLFVMPGMLAISRRPACRDLRRLGLGTSVLIVLLMWGECLRLGFYRALEDAGAPDVFASSLKIQFWLLRELGWWWTISFMLAVLIDFLQASAIMRWLSPRFHHSAAGVR